MQKSVSLVNKKNVTVLWLYFFDREGLTSNSPLNPQQAVVKGHAEG